MKAARYQRPTEAVWPRGNIADVFVNLEASITITNTGSTAINGWTLKFTFPGSQQVTQGWTRTPVTTPRSLQAAWSIQASMAPGVGVIPAPQPLP